MALQASYLGMTLSIADLDRENLDYFRYCAGGDYHLQCCTKCSLIRYPPTTACPWCSRPESRWVPVEGRGAVHSYTEVHHAIQPGLRDHAPYLVLLVELDAQRGKPSEHEALRVIGNLALPDGSLAPREMVRRVGIGTRMRMVFTKLADGLALPQWTIDERAPQPASVWRYPLE
jgi:uncharacterized protein